MACLHSYDVEVIYQAAQFGAGNCHSCGESLRLIDVPRASSNSAKRHRRHVVISGILMPALEQRPKLTFEAFEYEAEAAIWMKARL